MFLSWKCKPTPPSLLTTVFVTNGNALYSFQRFPCRILGVQKQFILENFQTCHWTHQTTLSVDNTTCYNCLTICGWGVSQLKQTHTLWTIRIWGHLIQASNCIRKHNFAHRHFLLYSVSRWTQNLQLALCFKLNPSLNPTMTARLHQFISLRNSMSWWQPTIPTSQM